MAIYSQFMSIDNNLILNATLVITAGIVDAVWYILLVYLVTSGMVFGLIKRELSHYRKNYWGLVYNFIDRSWDKYFGES